MFNKQKDRSLTQYEISEIQGLVTNTLNRMLNSGEVVFDGLEKHDLLVSFAAIGEYIQGSVFQLSKCKIINGSVVELQDPPLFVGQRHYLNMEDFQDYMNEEALEELGSVEIQACLLIGGLIRSFNLQRN
jgi:hypothetical protein